MSWRSVVSGLLYFLGRVLSYAYLLRFPLLTAFGIVGFCVAAFFSSARLLLGNIFDIGWTGGIFFASWTAFLAGLVVMMTSRLVLLYGPERFFDRGGRPINGVFLWVLLFVGQCAPIALPVFLMFAVAFSVVVGAVYKSTLPTGQKVLEVLLGLLATLLCLVVAFGVRWLVLHLTGRSAGRPPTSAAAQTFAERFTGSARFRRISENLGRGYLKYENDEAVSILPGHIAAFALLALTLVFYGVIGWVKYLRLGEPALVPALSYILLLAMLLCWALSGAAFFLDRYRIPVLIPLLLWLGLNTFSPWSEYYYPVTDSVQGNGSTSSNAGGRTGAPPGKIIVVAANGGGIQAAAWTAQVLTGLETKCRTKCDYSFGGSIRLISSVSGGSVGTMYFLNEYEEDRRLPKELNAIVTRTEGSSLDEISWGVLYPDLMRTFFPNPFVWNRWDRGRALEVAWLRHDVSSWPNREGIQQGLSEWRKYTELGDRPAVIFNTAVVETGLRLPLATTDLPEDSPGKLSYDQYFGNIDPQPDIPVVTAVRLSASFPYVSPAARAAVEGEKGHLVDGGYYDNYGISSLVEWLDEELKNNASITDVLVLEIRGAHSGPGDSRTDDPKCATEPKTPKKLAGERASFSQILAPPLAVLSVRNTGQRTHNDVELDLLQDKWNEKDDHKVDIRRAVFEFDGADPPLSWHLTNEQKVRIRTEWREELNDPRDACAGWDRVKDFLEKEVEGSG